MSTTIRRRRGNPKSLEARRAYKQSRPQTETRRNPKKDKEARRERPGIKVPQFYYGRARLLIADTKFLYDWATLTDEKAGKVALQLAFKGTVSPR
jgi:hypothetical protein